MALLVFIVVNLLLMAGLFLAGVYLFMQVDEKRKVSKTRRLDSSVDQDELKAMLQAQGQDEAMQRLMQADDVDRFTAEQAIEGLKRQVRQAK